MGIERFFKQLKNDTYSLTDLNKHIYLVKNNASNAEIYFQSKKNTLSATTSDILNQTTAFYMDYPSIIYNVSAKYRGIINDLVRVLIYRPHTIETYISDPDVLSEIREFIIRNKSDSSIDINLTLENINRITQVENDGFIIDKVLAETIRMVILMKNLRNIYIYFDGVPNVAKMKEQLHRRVNRVAENLIYSNIADIYLPKVSSNPVDIANLELDKKFAQYKYSFDESKISPKNILLTNIRTRLLKDLIPALKVLNTLSSYNPLLTIEEINIPGEAEHKILAQIKSLPSENCMFYSPDADTILLASYLTALGKPTNIIRFDVPLSRETHKWIYQYFMIDIEKFNRHLLSKTIPKSALEVILPETVSGSNTEPNPKTEPNPTKSIDDVIRELTPAEKLNRIVDVLFIFNLLGDDFIPKINSINIMNDYNLLFISYIALNKKLLRFEPVDGSAKIVWKINSENLFEYLRLLSIGELDRFEVNKFKQFPIIHETSILSNMDPSEKFPYKMNYVFISEMFKKGFVIIKNESPEIGNIYTVDDKSNLVVNKSFFNTRNLIKSTIIKTKNIKIVRNYLQGFQYILDLYFNGEVKNQYWYFKYNNAPTLFDVVRLITKTIPSLSSDPSVSSVVTSTVSTSGPSTESESGSESETGLGPITISGTSIQSYLDDIFRSYETKPVDSSFKFFTINEHDCFIRYHVDQFRIAHSTPTTEIKYRNALNIYECLNAGYINKCSYKYMQEMTEPNEFLTEFRADPTNAKFAKCQNVSQVNSGQVINLSSELESLLGEARRLLDDK